MSELIVVGDKFAGFAAEKPHVRTMSEFAQDAWRGTIDPDARVVIGQGVEFDRFHAAATVLKQKHGAGLDVVNVDQIDDQVDPAHRANVHKRRRENVLVSRPTRVDDDTYFAWLSIQDSSELLADHMTGQHIQGIVLTEAARQMLLATSEMFLLEAEAKGRCYFVLTTLGSTFLKFAFPLPIDVRFRCQWTSRKPGKSLRVSCTIDFYQCKEVVASVVSDYTAFSAEYIADMVQKTSKAARQSLRVEQTEQPRERVMARQAVAQLQKLAEQIFSVLGKVSEVDAALAAGDRRHQRDRQHVEQAVARRVAGARVGNVPKHRDHTIHRRPPLAASQPLDAANRYTIRPILIFPPRSSTALNIDLKVFCSMTSISLL